MGFKSDFYKLIEKYKTLPYVEEHVDIEKGKKTFKICLDIEERTPPKALKPTHEDLESLIKYMASKEDAVWIGRDYPWNAPPLIGFVDADPEADDKEYCSISAHYVARKLKRNTKVNFRNQILKLVEKRKAAIASCLGEAQM